MWRVLQLGFRCGRLAWTRRVVGHGTAAGWGPTGWCAFAGGSALDGPSGVEKPGWEMRLCRQPAWMAQPSDVEESAAADSLLRGPRMSGEASAADLVWRYAGGR